MNYKYKPHPNRLEHITDSFFSLCSYIIMKLLNYDMSFQNKIKNDPY